MSLKTDFDVFEHQKRVSLKVECMAVLLVCIAPLYDQNFFLGPLLKLKSSTFSPNLASWGGKFWFRTPKEKTVVNPISTKLVLKKHENTPMFRFFLN